MRFRLVVDLVPDELPRQRETHERFQAKPRHDPFGRLGRAKATLTFCSTRDQPKAPSVRCFFRSKQSLVAHPSGSGAGQRR